MKIKVIKNLTSMPQTCIIAGNQVILKPKEEKVVSEQTAKAFLEACGPCVAEVVADEVGGVAAQTFDGDEVWLANMTGDPDAPDTIQGTEYENKRWKSVSVINPKREPLTLHREFDLGMKTVVGSGGTSESLNLGQIVISLPPFTRKKFAKNIANWFLQRDAMQQPGMAGAAIRSRAPSTFEPTLDWALDDMRIYLQLCDHTAVTGPSHDELVRKAVTEKQASDLVLYEARLMAMRRLHFRLANPAIRLPTKLEFDEYKAAVTEQQKAAAKKVA